MMSSQPTYRPSGKLPSTSLIFLTGGQPDLAQPDLASK
jgi:hypothetical protein